MTLDQYIEENRSYMEESAMSVIEQLDQPAFDALCALNAELTGDEEPGMSSKIALTHGEVSDFDGARLSSWAECRKREDVTGGVIFYGVQVKKGQPRVDLAVMQWGDKVIALTA